MSTTTAIINAIVAVVFVAFIVLLAIRERRIYARVREDLDNAVENGYYDEDLAKLTDLEQAEDLLAFGDYPSDVRPLDILPYVRKWRRDRKGEDNT